MEDQLVCCVALLQHRGQGNLWEDPGTGQPWNAPPPMVSGQPSSSGRPGPSQAAAEAPSGAAFNMDDELLQLEQQTKVLKRLSECPCTPE